MISLRARSSHVPSIPCWARNSSNVSSLTRLFRFFTTMSPLVCVSVQGRCPAAALLCLLDEAVQKDHMAFAHAEDHPRNPVAIKIASYLPQVVPKRSTMRTPDWPAKLNFLNVLPYRLAVFER